MLRQDVELSEEAKVHGCLTLWLIGTVLAVIRLIIVIVGGGFELWTDIFGPRWHLGVSTVLGLTNLIFLFAIWKWKKWGVFGLTTSVVISIAVNLSGGLRITYVLGPIVGIIILVALVKPRWYLFT
jgi:hypothetical protein